jgi:hypothetical protein
MTDDHPAIEELSAFLDNELTIHETTAMRDHVDACLQCSRELERLETGRRALSAAGLPIAPAGAMESAVSAALLSAALASAAPASPGERPASTTGQAAADDDALVAVDTQSAKRRASRYRHHQLVAKAAAAVLIVGAVGGGIYGLIRADDNSSSSASAGRAAFPAQRGVLPSPKSTPASRPPLGAFVLQLRTSTGRAPCSKALQPEVESIGGTRVVVDPPAADAAVMYVPAAAGQAKTCIGVAPAFVSLWSADISQVTIEPVAGPRVPASTPAAGPAVDLVVALAPAAITDSSTLEKALKGELTVEAIAQGVDLGTAKVTKGPVATLTVSRSAAASLRDRLLGHSQPSA